MKEQISISELFAKAAQEPVHTSFDATKQLFLASVPTTGTSSAVKTGLLTKKWIIMFSIIITSAVIGTSILLSGDAKKAQLSTNSLPKVEQQFVESPPSTPQKSKEKPASYHTKRDVQLPKVLPTLALTVELDNALIPIVAPLMSPNLDRKLNPQPYHFPQLTADEIKYNEKRKKNMVKSLAKMDKNLYAFVPSGTIKIDSQQVSIQSFIVQKQEVTNIEYKTFLFDLLIQDRKDDFLKAKPDQKKWTEKFGDGMKPMEENYFSNDAYDNYPVVNVSREGAEMYCIWLSQQLHKYTNERGDAPFNDVRLPFRSEWIYAANSGVDTRVYPWESDSITNETGCYLANHLPETGNYADDGGFDLVKVDSYNPNDFGLYCMAGNAAEMVYDSIEGKRVAGTAGGSWTDSAEVLKIHSADPRAGLTEADPSVGFRVVLTYFN